MLRVKFILCGLLMAVGCVATASASPELREKIKEMAVDVLANTKQQPVSVGEFTPNGLPDSNSGPNIQQLLIDALEDAAKTAGIQGGIVRKNAAFEVKGDYGLINSIKNPKLKSVKITARIIDINSGDELKEKRVLADLDENRTIAEVLQVTTSLNADGSREERNKKIVEDVKLPKVHIHGTNKTLVSSTAESPYAMEILVKPLTATTDATPRAVEDKEGIAFVDIQKTELYEVKIYNNSDDPVAVALSIDGLDMYHFTQDRNKDGTPRYTHTIFPPKSSGTIVGWHNKLEGNENYLSFLVTEHGKGAVTKAGIKSRGKVGVIHAQFSKCLELPPGESARGGNETGFGPPREVKQEFITIDVNPPQDFVSIRYTKPQE